MPSHNSGKLTTDADGTEVQRRRPVNRRPSTVAPAYSFNVDPRTGAQVGEGQFGAGRNGKLRNDHSYVSALIVVSERLNATDYFDELPIDRDRLSREDLIDAIVDARKHAPEGSYPRVDVFKTLSSDAMPVPEGAVRRSERPHLRVRRRARGLRADPRP